MKTNYLLILTALLSLATRANTPEPSSALAFQQTTNTRIAVEENHLRFFTGGSERMTIDADGNVGIGTTTLPWKLNISGEQHPRINLKSSLSGLDNEVAVAFTNSDESEFFEIGLDNEGSNAFYIGNKYFTNKYFTVKSNGNVGIGTTNPGNYRLNVHGQIKASGLIDVGLDRPANASTEGLFVKGVDGNGYASIQLATRSWSGSHAILFNAYKSSTMVNGGLGSVGNTKFTHNVGSYGGGAASIFYTGNGGVMSFHISQTSTGAGSDVNWGTAKLKIQRNGTVGININDPNETYMLHVNGKTYATSFHTATKTYADFVFEDNYRLAPLSEVEEFIEENNHLPDIPSEAEARKNGVDLQEMQAKLLQKIEELTLYVIEQQKEINELKSKINSK